MSVGSTCSSRKDRRHVGAHLTAHIPPGYCAAVHQILLHPDEVYLPLSRLIVEYALQTVHALAGYLVIHDYRVDSVFLRDAPHLVHSVLIASLVCLRMVVRWKVSASPSSARRRVEVSMICW